MKVILLGDLHMGARGGDLDFAAYFNRFFTDVLYPYMEEHNISTIIQAGDYFDKQTSLDYDPWKMSKPVWVDEVIKRNYRMYILVGNHDIAYKNTLRVNSPDLILYTYAPHIQVLSEPTNLNLDGYSFDVVPWICKENQDRILSFMKRRDRGSAVIGHFSIEGFPMYKGGQVEKKGLPKSTFEHYPFVFSGHFHTKSSDGNISYLGVPYEITWADFNDQKGFHVFDTEMQTVEFVPNPYTMYEKLLYSEGMVLDSETLTGKIVRLVVTDRGNLKKYNAFIDELKKMPLKDLDIVETTTDIKSVSEVNVDDLDWINDTETYIKNVVDTLETDLDKSLLSDYMIALHNRAISSQLV